MLRERPSISRVNRTVDMAGGSSSVGSSSTASFSSSFMGSSREVLTGVGVVEESGPSSANFSVTSVGVDIVSRKILLLCKFRESKVDKILGQMGLYINLETKLIDWKYLIMISNIDGGLKTTPGVPHQNTRSTYRML